MKKKFLKFGILFIFLSVFYGLDVTAQGIIVYKKDGTKIKVPFEQLDSISTSLDSEDFNIKDETEEENKEGEQQKDEANEAVDLGLSVKWATCNVGASSPEECGEYFAWGELEGKTYYNDDNYKYFSPSNGGSGWLYIGFNISGTKYDVAYAKKGSDWRMPTKDELEELINECTWEWTKYKGVNGQMVTGPNGNSIFIPAAGYNGRSSYGNGNIGYYWSSMTYKDSEVSAYILEFINDACSMTWLGRSVGASVRPVRE